VRKKYCISKVCVLHLYLCRSDLKQRNVLPVFTQVHSHDISMSSLVTQYVNFDSRTFLFLGNILPENDCIFEFDSYLLDFQVLQRFIEFNMGLVQYIRDHP